MPKALSDMTIRTLPQGIFWDTKLPGFGVRVGKRTITFIINTGTTRIKIGTYPSLSLGEARRRVFALKADPETVAADTTLNEALTLFYETHCSRYRPKVLKETKRYLAKYSDTKLAKLSTQDVYKVIDAQTHAEANKLFTISRTFFRFCVSRKLLQRSPIDGLQPPHKTTARSRVLTDEELSSIWNACSRGHSQLPRPFAAIVCLLTLTGMRRTECASLEAKFFRDDLCTLPHTLCKNGREHCFPVGDFSKRLLAPFITDAPSGLLFAARGCTDRPFSGWSKSKTALDSLSGITDWTLHDLRRTYRTIHARIGTPPHIAERLVNHVSSRSEVEAIYDRFNYLEPMHVAVRNFEDFFGKLISGNHAATSD